MGRGMAYMGLEAPSGVCALGCATTAILKGMPMGRTLRMMGGP